MIYKQHFFLILSCLAVVPCTLNAKHVFEGDQHNKTSFSFPLGHMAFSSKSGLCIIGSDEEKEGNEYALAFATRSSSKFGSLAIPKIELNGKEKQDNPLIGAAFNTVTFMKGGDDVWPLIISRKEPNRMYLLQTYVAQWDEAKKEIKASNIGIVSSPLVEDAQKQPASKVLGIAGGYPYILIPLSPAAVSLHEGFDLALGYFYYGVREEAKKEEAKLKKLQKGKQKAVVQEVSQATPQKEIDKAKVIKEALKKSHISFVDVRTDADAPKALPIRLDHPALAWGNAAHSFLHTHIPVEWSDMVKTWYVPLHVKASLKENSGACALLVAHYDEKKGIELKPFVSFAVLEEDSIVTTAKPGQEIGVFHTASLGTTTWLPYLVVVGGAGNEGKRQVSALPVVGGPDMKTRGTLAKKNQIPDPDFSHGELTRRTFLEPALEPADVPQVNEPAVCVGGGLAPGEVTRLHVCGDAVFVAVEASEETCGGLFHSQALFDGEGRIVGWTPWQPAGGINEPVKHFDLDEVGGGNYWYIPSSAREVMRTEWKPDEITSDNSLSSTLTAFFKTVPSGIQGLKAYSHQEVGMSKVTGERASFLVATGYERVVLVETGNDTSGSFAPITHFKNTHLCTDGSLKDFHGDANVLVLTGGVLKELGPIVASALVTDGHYAWLAVAGSGGVAILARPDGTGISLDSEQGLGHGFKGLSNDMRFVKLGYKNVHTLLAAQNALCIVMPTSFGLYPVSSQAIKEQTSYTLVGVAKQGSFEKHSYFLDAWASSNYLFIGTDKGLMYRRIDPICNGDTCTGWQTLSVPYSAGAISRFYALQGAKRESGIFNLYVLSTSASADQARLYRYVLDESGQLEPLIELLPDVLLQSTGKAFLMNLGVYRSYFTTDGALGFFTGSIFGSRSPAVDTCLIDVHTRRRNFVDTAQTILKIADGSSIGAVIREPASGAWIAWGSFGVRVAS